jgi:hypothetical protein
MTSVLVAQNPKPPTLTDSPECDDCVTLIYNPADGYLSFSVGTPPPDDKLTTLEIRSLKELFIPGPIDIDYGVNCHFVVFYNDFDRCTPQKLVKIRHRGFGSRDLGNLLPTGLSGDELVADLIMEPSHGR